MFLNNKRILVTGAAGSLGQAVCCAASSYGATVIGIDILDIEGLSHAEQYRVVNLLNQEEVQATLDELEQIDALVNVAGGFAMGLSAYDLDDNQWDHMFRLNVHTLRNAVKAVVPRMRAQGRGAIVNIGAFGALQGSADMSAYCASKSTVMRLTESLSEELKGDGININAVLPSIIDTEANRRAMPEADFSNWVSPEQLAEVICFLASDAASGVHGALVPVRGLV
jgi:NAD(P)-dependent dehydrogenase (short-subunit alcohol dehydrogenase family)